jgi:hypothetical protein
MPEKPEIFEKYAKECRGRAEAMRTPDVTRTFRELAAGWTELAALRRRLEAERRSYRAAVG